MSLEPKDRAKEFTEILGKCDRDGLVHLCHLMEEEALKLGLNLGHEPVEKPFVEEKSNLESRLGTFASPI